MKTAYKNIIKLIIFMSIVFILIVELGKLFTPRWEYDDYQGQAQTINGFYNLPENSIDILFMGDSSIYKSVSPMQIYESTHIKSYNYSVSSARLYMIYYQLLDILEYQHPKVLFIDTLTFFYSNKESETERRKSFDYFRFGKHKQQMIHDEVFEADFDDKVSYYFPLFRYHSRWHEISIADIKAFFNNDYHSINKGFVMTSGSMPNKNGYAYMQPKNRNVKMQKYVKKYFYNIIKLCKENNIEIVFLGIPDKRAWNYESSVLMNELATKTNTKFLDLNDSKKYKVDWSIDSEDGGGHFNILGAQKITNYVTQYIKDNYDIKGSEDKEWNKDLIKYNKLKDKTVKELYEDLNK